MSTAPDRAGAIRYQVLQGDDAIRSHVAEAATLIAAAFPRPTLETSAEVLAWHLTGVAFGSGRPVAVVATEAQRIVGFAAATPRPLSAPGVEAVGHVVSFVCVDPAVRGLGIAARLYDHLLDALPDDALVLTFAIDGEGGMRVLEHAYPRHGFLGRSLGILPPFGVLRRRVGAGSDSPPGLQPPAIALRYDTAVAAHLGRDPRGAHPLSVDGVWAIAAWRLTAQGREPFILMENLASPPDGAALGALVAEAFALFPDHGAILVIPNLPAASREAARSVGLRQIPGASYRAWIWSRTPNDPMLLSECTTHPVL